MNGYVAFIKSEHPNFKNEGVIWQVDRVNDETLKFYRELDRNIFHESVYNDPISLSRTIYFSCRADKIKQLLTGDLEDGLRMIFTFFKNGLAFLNLLYSCPFKKDSGSVYDILAEILALYHEVIQHFGMERLRVTEDEIKILNEFNKLINGSSRDCCFRRC